MSQSNSNFQLAVPYLAKTDGRSRKFPKGTKVNVLWRGTTNYGDCARVISVEEFYGKVKQETDKAFLIDLADLIEPEWFPKSAIVQRGKLTDREQHGFEAPLWILKKKVGEVKAKMFTDCRTAIEKRLVT